MRSDSIQYLHQAGFDFKPAESPDLWTHLESHFQDGQRIGARFRALPSNAIAELIRAGEDALLEAMATRHRATGRMESVAHVLDMPFVIGLDDCVAAHGAKEYATFMLVDRPGESGERLMRVLPAGASDMQATKQATVSGGVFADGHTVGLFDLALGNNGGDDPYAAHLATLSEIASLMREMESNGDAITVASKRECAAMIRKVRNALKV